MVVRVLIVDDQPDFARALSLILGLEDDIEIVGMAHDGLEAITAAQRLEPDIILLDINMPRFNGFDTLAQIRKEGPACKIVMLSGSAQDKDRITAQKLGADEYVVKTDIWDELPRIIGRTHAA